MLLILFKFCFDVIAWFSLVVEDEYDGPRLSEDGISREFVEELIERFTDQKKIHKKYAYKVTTTTSTTTMLYLFIFFCLIL